MTAFLKTEVTLSNTLEHRLPARPEVFSQVFKCLENLQDLEPTQTKCKENAGDGAGNTFKFFKWFEYTAWIKKKKKWGWEEIQTLDGVTLLTNCFFVHHLTWSSRQLGMVRWAPVLQGGKRRLGVWMTCPESYSWRGCKGPAPCSSLLSMLVHNWG